VDEATKRALDAALASPEFMAQVKAAVLESPIVKAKDAEVATLRARVEAAEAEVAALRGALEDAARSLDWIATQRATDLVSEMRQYARSRAQVAYRAALRGGKGDAP